LQGLPELGNGLGLRSGCFIVCFAQIAMRPEIDSLIRTRQGAQSYAEQKEAGDADRLHLCFHASSIVTRRLMVTWATCLMPLGQSTSSRLIFFASPRPKCSVRLLWLSKPLPPFTSRI